LGGRAASPPSEFAPGEGILTVPPPAPPLSLARPTTRPLSRPSSRACSWTAPGSSTWPPDRVRGGNVWGTPSDQGPSPSPPWRRNDGHVLPTRCSSPPPLPEEGVLHRRRSRQRSQEASHEASPEASLEAGSRPSPRTYCWPSRLPGTPSTPPLLRTTVLPRARLRTPAPVEDGTGEMVGD